MNPLIVRDLSGQEKEYILPVLLRKDAADIFQNTCLSLFSIVRITLHEHGSPAAATEVSKISFDDFWLLARRLLSDKMIVNKICIGDIDNSNYFEENPDELYIAIFNSIRLNYPNIFFASSVKGKENKPRFWPRSWGQDRDGSKRVESKLKYPEHSLYDEQLRTYRVAKYFNVSPEEVDNWSNINFLDRQEYMFMMKTV